MKKSKFNYSDFSKRELEDLKEYYIEEKVKSMSEYELKKFVHENISHQIKNTIGDEEEKEAWEEIENFFSDNFEMILEGIKKKFERTSQGIKTELPKNTNYLQEKKTDEAQTEKIDMWID